jgi:hypothetical protein
MSDLLHNLYLCAKNTYYGEQNKDTGGWDMNCAWEDENIQNPNQRT